MAKKDVSRRDLLFGGARRIQENLSPEKAAQNRREAAANARAKGDDALCGCDYFAAETAYRDCLITCGKDAETRRYLAYAMYRQDKLVQARVECVRLLRDHGSDAETSVLLGLCHLRLGNPQQAVAAWDEADLGEETAAGAAIAAHRDGVLSGDEVVLQKAVHAVEKALPGMDGYTLLANVE